METRLVIAYGIIAMVGVGTAVFAIVAGRRRAARRLRLRGIKTLESRASQSRAAARNRQSAN